MHLLYKILIHKRPNLFTNDIFHYIFDINPTFPSSLKTHPATTKSPETKHVKKRRNTNKHHQQIFRFTSSGSAVPSLVPARSSPARDEQHIKCCSARAESTETRDGKGRPRGRPLIVSRALRQRESRCRAAADSSAPRHSLHGWQKAACRTNRYPSSCAEAGS